MSRVPALPREQLRPEQQAYHDTLSETSAQAFGDLFTWRRQSDHALVGPFPAFLRHPETGATSLKYFEIMSKIPGLSPEAREVAILAVGAHYKAAFELYAHKAVAKGMTKLEPAQVDQIAGGEKPEGLDHACDVAYDVATRLAKTPGPLPQNLWDRSIEVLGLDGTMGVVHYTGFYAYVSILLNAVDAPVPTEGG